MAKNDIDETRLTLYALLVDQLLRYQTVIWQIPTALVAANFIALQRFFWEPLALFALAFFNLGLIYTLHRMILQQRALIVSAKKSNEVFRKKYGELIPQFPVARIPGPFFFLGVIWILEAGLIVYAIVVSCMKSRGA